MNDHEIAILTTIYPMDPVFVDEFFFSLNNQTVDMFDILIVNDGFGSLAKVKSKYRKLNIVEVDPGSTAAENRQIVIHYARQQGYKIGIFSDCDDYLEKNRVKVCVAKLCDFDIVVNDITLFNRTGISIIGYLTNRIENNSVLDITAIQDKNIFGLTNTAIRLDRVIDVVFDKDLVAVDWFLFSVLLLNGSTAVFTNETFTYYRQHGNNIVGLGVMDKMSLAHCLQIKKNHYKLLESRCADYSDLLFEVTKLESSLKQDVDLKNYIERHKELLKYPLWWETI